MRKAEAGINNEGTFGSIESFSGEEGTIWNHGSGWTRTGMLRERCGAKYPRRNKTYVCICNRTEIRIPRRQTGRRRLGHLVS